MPSVLIPKTATLNITFPYIINSGYSKQIYRMTLEVLKSISTKGIFISFDAVGMGEVYIIEIERLIESIDYNIEGISFPSIELVYRDEQVPFTDISFIITIKTPSINIENIDSDVSQVVINVEGELSYIQM